MTAFTHRTYHQLDQSMQGLAFASAVRIVACAAALTGSVAPPAAPIEEQSNRRLQQRLERALARDADALVEVADNAAAGRVTPTDFEIRWRNDFFKAQPGTFVPFIVSFDASRLSARSALLYVRVQRRSSPRASRQRDAERHAYETIFPVEIEAARGRRASVSRGFAVLPGRYQVVVVLRESLDDGEEDRPRKTAALVRDIDVPDFWTGELATSTVILAERLETLRQPVPTAELDEDPYVVGSRRIHPAVTNAFGRDRELIVVFLVYNPTVDREKHFDVQVDYHLYRKIPEGGGQAGSGDHPPPRPGERYVTRTNPQRFNPALMGRQFDPGSGDPVLAGQGILLGDVEPGEYRLLITVTDLVSRRSLTRDVLFMVTGS